jgi:hypothetical protein
MTWRYKHEYHVIGSLEGLVAFRLSALLIISLKLSTTRTAIIVESP